MKNTQFSTDIVEHAIDGLDCLIQSDREIDGSDLHHELFNVDYFIIGYYQAEKWISENYGSAFKAIDRIKEYELSNFGEQYTDLTDSEKVANMIAYIEGEELLSNLESTYNIWCEHLTVDDLKEIRNELTAMQ